MTPEQIAELRESAEAAGSEEWWLSGEHDTVWGADGTGICKTFPNIGHDPDPVDERQLAEFIAAANPATILALLDHIDQVRASTIEECAKVCDRNATYTVDDSEMWTVEACAHDIRALALPAATGSENILEKD